jgi:hypothetical protein
MSTLPGPTLPDPTSIMNTAFGFWGSKVLLTAVELGVFTALGQRRVSGAVLGGELGLHPRGIADFFDALLAMKFLARDGDGDDAVYYNTPATACYLDRTSPRYLGGMLEMMNARLFKFWHDLPEALRTGEKQNEAKGGAAVDVFAAVYADPARLEQFLAAMTGLSRGNFELLAERFDFSPYRTLCDVGGAAAVLAIEVARKHRHLHCTSFDLAQVEPIARRGIAEAQLGGRVTTRSGSFLADPLPAADVITMSMILHDWNLETKQMLIRKAYAALPEGGAFIAIDAIIDDARRVNTFGLLMSLNMLIENSDAFDYTGAELRRWCSEAGFRRFDVLPLAGPASAVIAYK